MTNDEIVTKFGAMAINAYVTEVITWEQFVEMDAWLEQAWERGRDK